MNELIKHPIVALRHSLINDFDEINDILSQNTESSLYLLKNSSYNILSHLTCNINRETPNQTFCVLIESKVVGLIQFYGYNKKRNNIHLGYVLDKNYQSKGIMYQACLIAITRIFDLFRLGSVIILAKHNNISSIKLGKKLGFRIVRKSFFDNFDWVKLELNKPYY